MKASGGCSPDELLLAVAPYPDTCPYRIQGRYFCAINQIESTDK